MLDRSTQPNLFDPRRLGVAATEEEPLAPRDTEPPPPRTPRRADRTRRHGASARSLLKGPLRDRLRRAARYLPVAVLLGLALRSPAGCGRSATRTHLTRSVAASLPPAAPAAPARRSSVGPPPAHGAPRPVPILSARRHRTDSQPRRPASPRGPAPASRASAPGTPPARNTPPIAPPPPSFTGSEPVRRQESGGEFGFER